MIDINLLPVEYRPKPWALPMTFGLVMVIMALGYSLFTSFGRMSMAQDKVDLISGSLQKTQSEIGKLADGPRVKELLSELGQVRNELKWQETMATDYKLFSTLKVSWSPVLHTVTNVVPPGISLSSLVQKGYVITLQGKAPDSTAVVGYARELEKCGLFSQVSSSMSRIEPKPVTRADSRVVEMEAPYTSFQFELVAKPGGGR